MHGIRNAKDKVRVEGFPTETQIAAKVHEMPAEIQGKLLAEHSMLYPAKEPGHVIRFFMEHGKDFLGKRGVTTMVDLDNNPYANGAHFNEHKFLTPLAQAVKDKTGFTIPDPTAMILPKHSVLILSDERKIPMAMVLSQSAETLVTYGIYGTNPLHPDDKPELHEDGSKFYPWYRYQETDANHLEHRVISVWNGDEKEWKPVFRATPAKHLDFKHDLYPTKLGEVKFTMDSTGECVGFMIKKAKANNSNDAIGWHATVAPGMDPAVMACFGAIMDDYLPAHKIAVSSKSQPWA